MIPDLDSPLCDWCGEAPSIDQARPRAPLPAAWLCRHCHAMRARRDVYVRTCKGGRDRQRVFVLARALALAELDFWPLLRGDCTIPRRSAG